jgi:lipopolysaccharide export system permease protein
MTSAPYRTPAAPPRSWWPTLSVMDRYLARELIMPFLFGVAAFSSIGLAVGTLFELVREVVDQGLPIALALKVLLLRMPYFLVLSFPMSTLLATLMAYGRLSNDSELVALRSCGVSIYRLVMPALVLSACVTGLTFAFNEAIVPAANAEAQMTLARALDRDEAPSFRDENIFYREYGDVTLPDGQRKNTLTRMFYAERFDGEFMGDITVVDRSQFGITQIITANRARWEASNSQWEFFDGTIYIVSPDGGYRNVATFAQQTIRLPRTALDLAVRGRFKSDEVNIAQLADQIELLRPSGDRSAIVKLELRLQQKYALPFICFAFGVVGSALGNRRHQRLGRATSFGISVVMIFSYYLFAFVMDALGLKEVLSPVVATWTPIAVVTAFGGLLLMRASR